MVNRLIILALHIAARVIRNSGDYTIHNIIMGTSFACMGCGCIIVSCTLFLLGRNLLSLITTESEFQDALVIKSKVFFLLPYFPFPTISVATYTFSLTEKRLRWWRNWYHCSGSWSGWDPYALPHGWQGLFPAKREWTGLFTSSDSASFWEKFWLPSPSGCSFFATQSFRWSTQQRNLNWPALLPPQFLALRT